MPLPAPQPLSETWTDQQAGDYWRLVRQRGVAMARAFSGKGGSVSTPKGFVEADGQFRKKAVAHLLWLSQQGRLPEVLQADAVDFPWLSDWNRLSSPGGPGFECSREEAQWMERVWAPLDLVVSGWMERYVAELPKDSPTEQGARVRQAVLDFMAAGQVREEEIRHFCDRHKEHLSVSFHDWVPSLWVHRAPSYDPLTLEEAGLVPPRSRGPQP